MNAPEIKKEKATKAPKEPKAPKVVKEKTPNIEANGVVRPAAGTTTAKIWEIADSLSAASGAPAKRSDVLASAATQGINLATAATQFGKWSKFNGLTTARLAKVEKEADVPVAPAAVVEEVAPQ
jgi:hypothetical protein